MQGPTPAFAVTRAARRLAVEGDHLAVRALRRGTGPTEQAGLEAFRRQARDHVGDAVMRGHAVAKGGEPAQPLQLLAAKVLDCLPPIGAADDRKDRQQHDIDQRVQLVAVDPGIFQRREMLDDAC